MNDETTRIVDGKELPVIPPRTPVQPQRPDKPIAVCGACGALMYPMMFMSCKRPECPCFAQVTF